MDDGTEEYMLKWNSHNTEVISEFHELCRVSNKFSTNMYTYLYVSMYFGQVLCTIIYNTSLTDLCQKTLTNFIK